MVYSRDAIGLSISLYGDRDEASGRKVSDTSTINSISFITSRYDERRSESIDESPHFEEDLSISTKKTAKILSLFSDSHHRTSTSESSYSPVVSDCSMVGVGDDQVKTPSLTRSDVGESVEESPIIGYFHPGDDRRAQSTPRSREEKSNIIPSTVATNVTPSGIELIDGLNKSLGPLLDENGSYRPLYPNVPLIRVRSPIVILDPSTRPSLDRSIYKPDVKFKSLIRSPGSLHLSLRHSEHDRQRQHSIMDEDVEVPVSNCQAFTFLHPRLIRQNRTTFDESNARKHGFRQNEKGLRRISGEDDDLSITAFVRENDETTKEMEEWRNRRGRRLKKLRKIKEGGYHSDAGPSRTGNQGSPRMEGGSLGAPVKIPARSRSIGHRNVDANDFEPSCFDPFSSAIRRVVGRRSSLSALDGSATKKEQDRNRQIRPNQSISTQCPPSIPIQISHPRRFASQLTPPPLTQRQSSPALDLRYNRPMSTLKSSTLALRSFSIASSSGPTPSAQIDRSGSNRVAGGTLRPQSSRGQLTFPIRRPPPPVPQRVTNPNYSEAEYDFPRSVSNLSVRCSIYTAAKLSLELYRRLTEEEEMNSKLLKDKERRDALDRMYSVGAPDDDHEHRRGRNYSTSSAVLSRFPRSSTLLITSSRYIPDPEQLTDSGDEEKGGGTKIIFRPSSRHLIQPTTTSTPKPIQTILKEGSQRSGVKRQADPPSSTLYLASHSKLDKASDSSDLAQTNSSHDMDSSKDFKDLVGTPRPPRALGYEVAECSFVPFEFSVL